MNAESARGIAREWVREVAVHDPHFVGAVLHGSVNWMEDEAELAPSSDIDVLVIRDGDDDAAKPGKFIYCDLLLEVSYLPWEAISTPEAVLGNYQLAGSFQGAGLLADATGRLAELQAAVSSEYARREWVQRRSEHVRMRALQGFPMRPDDELHDQVTSWLFSTGALTHMVLVPALENPTVRKRYLAARSVLSQYGFEDEYLAMLDLLGARDLSATQVGGYLDAMTEAFDAAKQVIRTPFFFAADINDVSRSVAIDGSRDLIAVGDHREAIFWIVATYCRCRKVLTTDGAPGAHLPFEAGFQSMLNDLRVAGYDDRVKQIKRSRDEIPRVWNISNAIMSDLLASAGADSREEQAPHLVQGALTLGRSVIDTCETSHETGVS
ncbi:hypothetical protein BH09CHL1_BH09CHL1_31900 [soil metagenome]